jgi:O-antigen/teichoic acid export membrane protein
VIKSGLSITLAISLVMAFLVILFSGTIAGRFFDEPALEPLLWVFAAMIPLSVVFTNLISVLKGFQLMKYKVYFEDVLKSLSTIMLFGVFFWLGFDIIGAAYAYLAGFAITIIVALYVVLTRFPAVRDSGKKVGMGREMVRFAWPLMIAAYVKMVMSWTDTIALGYFGMAFNVGLYNIALPTAGIIHTFAVAFRHMLNPVLSELYAKEKHDELRTVFMSTAKWIFVLALPLLLLFVLFPDNVLGMLFGPEAVAASSALVILSGGFFMLSFMGASGTMFLVSGKTRISLYVTVLATAVNFGLNILLIPVYGIEGAAVATAISLVALSVSSMGLCYRNLGLIPLQSGYLKILVSGVLSVGLFYGVIKFVIGSTAWWILALAFPFFLALYGLLLVRMRGLDRHDIMILRTIERKSGMRSERISRLVSRLSK